MWVQLQTNLIKIWVTFTLKTSGHGLTLLNVFGIILWIVERAHIFVYTGYIFCIHLCVNELYFHLGSPSITNSAAHFSKEMNPSYHHLLTNFLSIYLHDLLSMFILRLSEDSTSDWFFITLCIFLYRSRRYYQCKKLIVISSKLRCFLSKTRSRSRWTEFMTQQDKHTEEDCDW
jgi:hypothetical protein